MHKPLARLFLLIVVLIAGVIWGCTSAGSGKMHAQDRSGTKDIGDTEDESLFNIEREVESQPPPRSFEKLDRDGDGRLGWVEFQRGSIDKLQFWEFQQFDDDGNGGLDREEFRKITEYMTHGEKPSGNPDKTE